MSESSSPYPGVNAHLNSFLLQPDGGWEMFHAEHIVVIRQMLDAVLPPDYYAASEKSLQITTLDEIFPRRVVPDVSIYRTGEFERAVLAGNATAPTAVLPIDDAVLDDEPEPHAVNIYRMEAGRIPGKLVTRLELISVANKPGGSHYRRYLQQRRETLRSHINLIEVDYLHVTHPIAGSIPSYPRGEPNATPYYVLVSVPHPSIVDGQMRLYAVGVDQTLPRLAVPLAEDDEVILDLQSAYNRTVDNARLLRLLADAAKPLLHSDRYSAADQARIRQLLKDCAAN